LDGKSEDGEGKREIRRRGIKEEIIRKTVESKE